MKVRSGHIIFEKGVKYSDLLPIYKEMFVKFLRETGQLPEEEDIMTMMITENIMDLEKNKKPEGYNRQGRMRMIFPIMEKSSLPIEFYIYGHYHSAKSLEVARVTESMSQYLKNKGFDNEVDWDNMLIHKYKK
ncbi:MAG: hypothetical protein KKH41_00585 [Candidatus Thermoplasmatota archaeon]|nr:hypothetical protein [Euryarchaeota archaeon]MBU4591058.1 hypothetical protein [Candidatus Thermoplasmatota archaeon]